MKERVNSSEFLSHSGTSQELKKLKNILLKNKESKEQGPGDKLDFCILMIEDKSYKRDNPGKNEKEMFGPLKKSYEDALRELKKENLLEKYSQKIQKIETFFKKYNDVYLSKPYVSVYDTLKTSTVSHLPNNSQNTLNIQPQEKKETISLHNAEIATLANQISAVFSKNPQEIKKMADALRNKNAFSVYMATMRSLNHISSTDCDKIETNYDQILNTLKKLRKKPFSFDQDIEILKVFLSKNTRYEAPETTGNIHVGNSLLGLKDYDANKEHTMKFDCSSYSMLVYCLMSDFGHTDIGIADSEAQIHAIFIHKVGNKNTPYDFSGIAKTGRVDVVQDSDYGRESASDGLSATGLLMSEYPSSANSSFGMDYFRTISLQRECETSSGSTVSCYKDSLYDDFLKNINNKCNSLIDKYNKKISEPDTPITPEEKAIFREIKKFLYDPIHKAISPNLDSIKLRKRWEELKTYFIQYEKEKIFE